MDKLVVERLRVIKANKARLFGRLLKKTYQMVSEYATEYLHQKGYKDFRVGHLVLLLNIEVEGTMVNALAHQAGVTKQAMSKLVQELHEYGYISTEKNPNDARAIIVKLTDIGARFILEWAEATEFIDSKFEGFIGKEKLETVKNILAELIEVAELNGKNQHNFADMLKKSYKF